jgi:hypothetical protein
MPFKSRRNAGSSRSFSLRERFERHHSEVQLTARAILLEADRVLEEGNTFVPPIGKSIQWGLTACEGLAR